MKLTTSISAMMLIHPNNFSVSEEDITIHLNIIQRTDQELQELILRRMFQMMLKIFLLSSDNNAKSKELELVNFSETSISLEVDLSLKPNLELD